MKNITVYSATYCSYCRAAKNLLTQLKLPFEEIMLDDKDELRAKLSSENGGWRTVPMIFIGEQFIGGFSELSDLHAKGQLTTMVGS